MTPSDWFALSWTGFFASWLLAAFWRSPAVHRATGPAVWRYRVLLVGGAIVLGASPHMRFGVALWPVSRRLADGLALATLVGFGFAWWARLHLGALWSSAVTRKQDHRVVETGPYGLVRHPIYTGIGFACLVSAIAVGTIPAILGLAAIIGGFWVKARLEEGLLRRELGADAYEAYRRRVPMLIPFVPPAR